MDDTARMMGALFVDLGQVPNFIVITGAVVAALAVIYRKVVAPVRDWIHNVKAWMTRMETGMTWVEAQMRPNGGGSLVDKVNMLLEHDRDRDVPGARYGNDNEGE